MANPFSNFSNIMQQAKEMQQKIKQVQEELNVLHVVGESGAGLIQLTVNGNGDALSIKIDDAVYNENKQILQGLIVAAINDANHKREIKKKELMNSMMSGMGLPPGFDFLSNLKGG